MSGVACLHQGNRGEALGRTGGWPLPIELVQITMGALPEGNLSPLPEELYLKCSRLFRSNQPVERNNRLKSEYKQKYQFQGLNTLATSE